jgi:hypothetical protein
MNRKVISIGNILAYLVLVISLIASSVFAQTAITFSPQNTFQTTQTNGAISFAYNGSYTDARLENDTWLFQNLIVNNYTLSNIPAWCLAISAQNSNITITSYSPGALTGLTDVASWLNYTVMGNGTQTANLDYGYSNYGYKNVPVSFSFSVYVDGVNRTQGDGWVVSNDGLLTISGATSNVSIYYPPNTWMDTHQPPSSITADESTNVSEFPLLEVVVFLAVSLSIAISVTVTRRYRTKSV